MLINFQILLNLLKHPICKLYHVCGRKTLKQVEIHSQWLAPRGEGFFMCWWEAQTLESRLKSSFAFLTWLQIRQVIFSIYKCTYIHQCWHNQSVDKKLLPPLLNSCWEETLGCLWTEVPLAQSIIDPCLKDIQYPKFVFMISPCFNRLESLIRVINNPNPRGGNKSNQFKTDRGTQRFADRDKDRIGAWVMRDTVYKLTFSPKQKPPPLKTEVPYVVKALLKGH